MLQEVGTVIYQQAAAEQAKQQGQPTAGTAGPEQEQESGPSGERVVDSEDYKVK